MAVIFESRPDRPSRHPSGPPRRRTKPFQIQEGFLFESLKEERRLVIALLTEELIQGRILRFDRYAIIADDGKHERLIFKHSIACIARASR